MGRATMRCAVVVVLVVVALLQAPPALAAGKRSCESKRVEHTKTYRSPGLEMRPGDVKNKYFNVEPPATGHFATVNFKAELVYENGEPVPQTDVYLHHWAMIEFIVPAGAGELVGEELQAEMLRHPPHVYHRRPWNGVSRELKEAWAMGGETHHLDFEMPAPYGLECGGVDVHTQWVLNVHAVDTRGALDRTGCYECKCHLFTGINHVDLPESYVGGMRCCPGESRCVLRDDVDGEDPALKRTLHLKYTWTYTAFDECVVPLRHIGVDVLGDNHPTVEYTVEGHCKAEDFHKPECVDVRESVSVADHGGDVVYVVAHLHSFGLGATLWGEDGRLICESTPIYGHGTAPGDEDGYVVGFRHCTPALSPTGTLGKIHKGEKLRFQVRYTKVHGPHTGVMGVGFVKVAEQPTIALDHHHSTPSHHSRKTLMN